MPKGLNMKRIILLILIIAAYSTNVNAAKQYCQSMPKAEKEGDTWYVPESAFTKDNALKALKELEDQIENGVTGRDFMIENELVMIKGHLYLSYLTEHEKEFGKEDVYLKKSFCEFIENEAYVSH